MASVAFDYELNKDSGFLQAPTAHNRFGYVTSLGGFGQPGQLTPDLRVSCAFNATTSPSFPGLQYQPGTPGSATVVGVIGQFSWNGMSGSPIQLVFYVSQNNALLIKASSQAAVNPLAWWLADYDQEHKVWYEAAYPLPAGTVSGVCNPGTLTVNLTAYPVPGVTGVSVYQVTLAVSPTGSQLYQLLFAGSSTTKVAKSWGLIM